MTDQRPGPPSDLPAPIQGTVAAIRRDNVHGASFLAREALRAVGAWIRDSEGVDRATLLDRVSRAATALGQARPEMAPIRVWLKRLQDDVTGLPAPTAPRPGAPTSTDSTITGELPSGAARGHGDPRGRERPLQEEVSRGRERPLQEEVSLGRERPLQPESLERPFTAEEIPVPEDPAKDQTSPYQAAELRAAILDVIDALVQQSERAGRLAAERAAEQLPPGSVVLTASDSMTIREAVRLARQVGRLRRLLVAESSDGRGHRYGELLANAVAAFGVPVEVVPDGEIAKRAASADRVWLGADTIYADGGILNGVGSFAVARAANAAGKPVVVIGESAKIDETASPDGVRLPPEMDYVPGELIDVIVTEAGPHPSAPSPRPRGEGECPRAAEVHGEPDQLLPIVPPLHGRVERHPGKGPRGSEAALVAAIAERLIARGEKVSVVESAAGGRLGDLLSDRPGSSAWLAGGILAYSNESKRDLVGVPADTLAEAGTVSAEVALAMAEGARRVFGTAWGVGESGIAGPQTGRRSHKPSGLAYVAVVGPNSVSRVEEVRTGLDDRGANKAAFAEFALRLLQSELDRTIGEVEGERR